MSEAKVDPIEVLGDNCTNYEFPVDNDDIIDVSGYNFEENDRWLYLPPQCSSESTVRDLHTWLKSDPEVKIQDTEGSRKCVDTRTFTRPKKRSGRLSFESIMEVLSPSTTNVWMPQMSTVTDAGSQPMTRTGSISNDRKESIPCMLKPAINMASNFLYDESLRMSGQESMEAFINMSQSNGIDSFINLTEPDFVDPLMNVSQPSMLYSSILSTTRDTTMHMPSDDVTFDISTSKNLSMHPDMSWEESESNSLNIINETVLRGDITLLGSRHSSRAGDLTHNIEFTNPKVDLNETYDMEDLEVDFPASQIVEKQLDVTMPSSLLSKPAYETMVLESGSKHLPVDITYQFSEEDARIKDSTVAGKSDKNVNVTVTVTSDNTIDIANIHDHESVLDATFNMSSVACDQSTPKIENALNSTYKANKSLNQTHPVFDNVVNSTFNASTLLRKELLAEVQRSKERKTDLTYNHTPDEKILQQETKENFDTTYDHIQQNNANIPVTNKYNTYRKDSSRNRLQAYMAQEVRDVDFCDDKDSGIKKFHTFTKKARESHIMKRSEPEQIEQVENKDATFCRPPSRLQKKGLQAPRALSKLPQFLQKSNPNLVLNTLKTANVPGHTNIARNYDGSTKLHSMQKAKSGSEQRLLEIHKNISEYCTPVAGGSMESIASTQSAHSAPDLDERLSVCSDSSHSSMRTMNIDQLHEIVRIQEESLNQESTPILNKKTLQKSWFEEKHNLPSPIFKNGVERQENGGKSPVNNFTVKTSSPLSNTEGGNESIHNVDKIVEGAEQLHNDDISNKKVEVTSKPSNKGETKTKLRQPANWNPGSRPPSAVSGIPRPASRIPGPKFTRQNVKTAQADQKKAFL